MKLAAGKDLTTWPVTDRYPQHWGARATVATVTNVLRLAEIGDRMQYVDLLRELIEGDPHAFGVLQTLFSSISGRPWTLQPPDDSPEAARIASDVTSALRTIPSWRQHVHGMLWSIVYGVTSRELQWAKRGTRWSVDSLKFIHSRRLAYDWDWKLCISDLGYGNFTVRIGDHPGKFWVSEPSLAEEYPTREGLGRTLAYWLAFKRFAMRDFASFVERFGHPIPVVHWKTDRLAADEDDITTASNVVKQLGIGTSAGAALPDTLTLDMTGSSTKAQGGGSGENTPHKCMIALCDEQVSKLVLGQAHSTNANQGATLGSKGDVFAHAQQMIVEGYARQIEESIGRDIITWIVRLNYGETAPIPRYTIQLTDEEGDLVEFASVLEKLVPMGLQVSAQWAGERFGVPAPAPGEAVLGSEEPKEPGSEEPKEPEEESEE